MPQIRPLADIMQFKYCIILLTYLLTY